MVTSGLSSRPVLPLFDGFAPPTPYAWANPPPEQAAGNVPPAPAEREFPLGPEGSTASNASTDDAQAIAGLDTGSVPPSPGETGVVVRLTPGDATALAPLPPGLRAVSNAYQVGLAYLPSQTPIDRLARKGTIALTAAEAGDRLLYSPDGKAWQEIAFRPYGTDNGLFTELESVGWFVVASSVAHEPTNGPGRGIWKGVLLAMVFVATVAAAFLVVRLPSPVPAEPVRRPAPSRSSSKKRTKRSKRRR